MSQSDEVVIEYEDGGRPQKLTDHHEEGVDVPLDRINPETMRNLIAEYVTKEWEELGDSRYTLDDKIKQVERQLQEKKAKVVFDLTSNTCNIVAIEGK